MGPLMCRETAQDAKWSENGCFCRVIHGSSRTSTNRGITEMVTGLRYSGGRIRTCDLRVMRFLGGVDQAGFWLVQAVRVDPSCPDFRSNWYPFVYPPPASPSCGFASQRSLRMPSPTRKRQRRSAFSMTHDIEAGGSRTQVVSLPSPLAARRFPGDRPNCTQPESRAEGGSELSARRVPAETYRR